MPATSNRLKIGISACFFHPNEERSLFKGKTLQYIEQSVAHWIMSQGDRQLWRNRPRPALGR
jgi:putative glutamine amidotransferase